MFWQFQILLQSRRYYFLFFSLFPKKTSVTHTLMLRLQVFPAVRILERHQDACGKGHLMAEIAVILSCKTCNDSVAAPRLGYSGGCRKCKKKKKTQKDCMHKNKRMSEHESNNGPALCLICSTCKLIKTYSS